MVWGGGLLEVSGVLEPGFGLEIALGGNLTPGPITWHGFVAERKRIFVGRKLVRPTCPSKTSGSAGTRGAGGGGGGPVFFRAIDPQSCLPLGHLRCALMDSH